MKRPIIQEPKAGRKKRKGQTNPSLQSICFDQEEEEQFVAFDNVKDNQPAISKIRVVACPWMSKKTADIRDSLLRFHNQIIEFHQYIEPTPTERQNRKLAFLELKKLIQSVVPNSQVKQYGSSALGLELPDGDIDVTILCQGDEIATLRLVYDNLKYDLAYQRIDFRRGKVPIINVHSVKHDFLFDISVNKRDGLNQLLQIQRMQNGLPQFKYLFMTLKCMLKIRGYSETYHGYVGSYLLFCMVFQYLFVKHDGFTNFGKKRLLSQDIIGFLDFYGNTNWSQIEVQVGRGITRPRQFIETSKPSYFRFLSPENEDDIGGRAFKIKEVFYFFRNRLQIIRNKNFRRGESVLKELLNPNMDEFQYPNRGLKL